MVADEDGKGDERESNSSLQPLQSVDLPAGGGVIDGADVGADVGCCDGMIVGVALGACVGLADGEAVGVSVGCTVGIVVGDAVASTSMFSTYTADNRWFHVGAGASAATTYTRIVRKPPR